MQLQLNLYLFQSLPEHEFASADVLVGEEIANLVEVELGGEVAGHRGDDVPHREAGKVHIDKVFKYQIEHNESIESGQNEIQPARVELVEDCLPVAL